MLWNVRDARERARRWRGLLNLGAPKRYGPRSQLFTQGDPATSVFLIEEGFVKLEVLTRDARQVPLIARFPGEWAGLCCASLDGLHFLSGTTATRAVVHEVEAARLFELAAGLPEAARLLRGTLAANFQRMASVLLALKVQSGRIRFERLLAELASLSGRKASRGRVRLRLPFSDAEIAALISVTPEHLSRIKRELETEGRFEGRGRLVDFAPSRACYHLAM